MSLRFPYKRFKVKNPLPSLAGRRERPRPMVTVTVIGPAGSHSGDALLDTGAGDTLFPEALAPDAPALRAQLQLLNLGSI